MQKHEANVHKPGRTTTYMVPDVMGKGMHITMTLKPPTGVHDGDDIDGEGEGEIMNIEDWGLPDEIEVEDDSSLDV